MINKIMKYIRTYIKWKWFKITEKYIQKNILLSFFLVVLSALLLHFVIPYNNFDLSPIAKVLKVEHLRDDIVIKAITTVMGSFTILISLLSAIYVFTYREQKSVSPSGSTDVYKNTLVSIVIFFMILNLIFAWLISNDYSRLLNENDYLPSLEITEYLFFKIIFVCLSFLLLLSQILKLIKYLFGTMSVDQMLSDSVIQTSKLFNIINNSYRSKKFNNLLNENYRRFHFSIESVFQNLKFAAENNMNKEFEENIDEFKDIFNRLNEVVIFNDVEIHVSTYLLKEDGVKFSQAYQSAIRCNLSLISNLLKNQQYNKAKTVVSLYINIYIDNDIELNKIFEKSLVELLDIIDVNDERQIKIYLEGLRKIPEHKTLIAYNFLIMKLINKNQMKNLTNVVYMFKNNIKNIKRYNISIVIILLQNLMKSIEISNYGITGFLVKFLFTNFSGKDISRGLKSLKRKPKFFTNVLEDEEKIEGINEDEAYAIVINDETFFYCYKKAYILLYAQHLYTIREKLWYIDQNETGSEIQLKQEFQGCDYSEYIITKVRTASNKYGLLFFEDKIVMKSVYNELNLSYPDSKKVNKDFSETFDLLVRKLFKL